jgi:hypothetical protein
MSRAAALVLLLSVTAAADVFAQAKPRSIEIGGDVMMGLLNFNAADSFDVALGSPLGSMLGGGARVELPVGGLFVNIGGWYFHGTGRRVFIFQGQEFPLDVPLEVTITPVEISGGWRFRFRRTPQFRPYVAAGFTSYGYKEVSDFATDAENVDERFRGYHLAGGAAFQVKRWVGVAWEVNWTSVPDAIGEGGVSAAFRETNLGGASLRFKITIGR